ncbi:RAD23 family protein [Spongiactinospora rosea]|uniref:hypothetical protein n=1 Tax=Spongiactinospora rosea TaxID=2248750 RepID=UPI0011C06C86|nr:hypothetical protein [Spongiactinospora rosea]
MDPDAFRDDLHEVDPEIYWRRRMALLVAVLIIVAVVAWACSRTSDAHQPPAARATPTGPDPLAALQASPRPGPYATPGARKEQKPSPTPAPTLSPEAATTPATRPGDPCARSDLVLNLQGEQQVYPGGTRPKFVVTLVNTGDVMCKTDVGPRALEIRITSGADRIWSTSDCISGDGVEIKRLERGIPYVRPVEWDRHRSGGRCGTARPGARPGTYVAAVYADDLQSPPKAVFHLR